MSPENEILAYMKFIYYEKWVFVVYAFQLKTSCYSSLK
jgi:hypothetical protein